MMWFQSDRDLREHPKLLRFMRETRCNKALAVGALHLLWGWCLDHAPDGELAAYDAFVLADAASWPDDPDKFFTALVKCGFVDVDDKGTRIHDWWDGAGKTIERLEAGRERAQRQYSRKKEAKAAQNSTRRDDDSTRRNSDSTQVYASNNNMNMNKDNKREDSSSSSMEGNKGDGTLTQQAAQGDKSPSAGGGDLLPPAPPQPDTPKDGKPPRACKGEDTDAFHERYMAWAKAVLAAHWHQYHEQWALDYPGVDIRQQCRAIVNYLLSHRVKRKKNLLAFATSWFQRNQERTGANGAGTFQTATERKHENIARGVEAFLAKKDEDDQ